MAAMNFWNINIFITFTILFLSSKTNTFTVDRSSGRISNEIDDSYAGKYINAVLYKRFNVKSQLNKDVMSEDKINMHNLAKKATNDMGSLGISSGSKIYSENKYDKKRNIPNSSQEKKALRDIDNEVEVDEPLSKKYQSISGEAFKFYQRGKTVRAEDKILSNRNILNAKTSYIEKIKRSKYIYKSDLKKSKYEHKGVKYKKPQLISDTKIMRRNVNGVVRTRESAKKDLSRTTTNKNNKSNNNNNNNNNNRIPTSKYKEVQRQNNDTHIKILSNRLGHDRARYIPKDAEKKVLSDNIFLDSNHTHTVFSRNSRSAKNKGYDGAIDSVNGTSNENEGTLSSEYDDTSTINDDSKEYNEDDSQYEKYIDEIAKKYGYDSKEENSDEISDPVNLNTNPADYVVDYSGDEFVERELLKLIRREVQRHNEDDDDHDDEDDDDDDNVDDDDDDDEPRRKRPVSAFKRHTSSDYSKQPYHRKRGFRGEILGKYFKKLKKKRDARMRRRFSSEKKRLFY